MLRLITLLAVIFSCHTYAGDVAAGKEKSQPCVACHGVDGNSPISPMWPKLAGQHEKYLYKQLYDFRSKTRENVQMNPFVETLSDDDIADLAAYYASQKVQPGYASAEMLDLGEEIYRAGNASKGLAACTGCHGPNGSGNPMALYPTLSGQHAAYTEAQLLAFRDNQRSNDPNKIMRIISEKMTIEEIKAVANYIQGLY